MPDLKQHQI